MERSNICVCIWRSSTQSPFQLRNVLVMRAIWKGSISFGLVNIPIALCPATRKEELKFRLLRAKDLSPVNYKRVAEKDGKEVPWEQIVKARTNLTAEQRADGLISSEIPSAASGLTNWARRNLVAAADTG